MNTQDLIATYYANARELIKVNQPKAARAYVVAILNEALKAYNGASTILSKARTAVFMERWIAVSRDLYDKGITDYVRECFGLTVHGTQAVGIATPNEQSKASTKKTDKAETPQTKEGEIDISGLIDQASKEQGWCADLFEANKRAVVEILISYKTSRASGTGFIISDNGYLLTNDHVVFHENNSAFHSKVYMSFVGDKTKYKIEPLFSDKKADVALCKFDPAEIGDFTHVKRITDYSTVKQGADCLVIGNAFGYGLAPFSGTIRYTKNNSGDMVYTAPSNPGDSGGPVFNRCGECIGINKSKTVTVGSVPADGYANATPMDRIDALLEKWTSANNIEL